ncbi:hypothetical protein [Roseivivax sp. THAF30]|uniref:hypothetical protein n=1 Tax=Roseivivax sp. THAF30 TaxID=2587852 RepID=UPI001269135E|nr:hypothetical protein [Roseivivax sp. THAF30]QFT62361.1 hypothetical protein FIU91_05420 [Roseivivax sp. THAF30]
MSRLSQPARFALVGLVAGLAGYGLSELLGFDLQSPWWVIMLAGGVGGFLGGWLRQRRGK